MKILLIGGTGILSSDIRDLAIQKGMDVYILNRGLNNKEIIDKRIKIIIGNIRNKNEIKDKIKDLYFDVVVDFLSFNIEQLKNTLNIFYKKCDQYIFISSATAYNKTSERIKEDFELKNEKWKYSQDKIECEEFLKKNYEENGQKYTIVRPYVTYSNKRIPFAIIPANAQWSLVNRILNHKPIVLWDDGQAICTLTYTKDFAVGIVGLFKNEKAYQEAFHITTDYTLSWKEALYYITKAVDKKEKPIIANIPSLYIVKEIPELKGVLLGDKGLDRIFDNTKIKSIVPEYNAQVKFEDGIKETIKFYKNHEYMKKIDYEWDARMDNLIEKYYKSIGKKNYIKASITNKYNSNQSLKEKIIYYVCRNDISYLLYKIIKKVVRKLKSILKKK